MTGMACQRPLGRGASPGVSAPSAYPEAGTHLPGICLVPVRVRLQGFSPSCRLASPASLRSFQTGNAHGVFPFEAFPSRGAATPLDARCPPAVACPQHGVTRKPHPAPDPAGSRALLPAGIRGDRTGVSRPPARCSPGVQRSRAFRSCVARGFPRTPLSDLALEIAEAMPSAGLSGSRSATWWRTPHREPCNPSALLAPRFRSAGFEPRRSGLAPTGPVTSLLRRPVQRTPACSP